MNNKTANRSSGMSVLLWVSAAVGLLACAASPMVLLMAASCCSGPHDPTNGVFLIPAMPAFFLMHHFGIDSELVWFAGFGFCYAALCFLLGLPAVLIRRAHQR